MLDSQTAADLISARLTEVDRTAAWLARQIGVDRALVGRWLKQERPIPAERRTEIALALGKPRTWLDESDDLRRADEPAAQERAAA